MEDIIIILGISIGAIVLLFVIFLLHHNYTHKRNRPEIQLCCNTSCHLKTTCHIHLQNNTHLLRGSECSDRFMANKYFPDLCKNYYNKDTYGGKN